MKGRKPRPWWNSEKGRWFVTVQGRRYDLGPDEPAALVRFGEILGGAPEHGSLSSQWTQFLRTHEDRSPSQQDAYVRYGEPFVVAFAKNPSPKSSEVQNWICTRWAGVSSRRHAVEVVGTFLRWTGWTGKLEKPRARSAERKVIGAEQMSMILAAVSPAAQDFLRFCLLTGCRPGEAAAVEAGHLVGQSIRLREHKTARATGKVRTIHLSPEALEIVVRRSQVYRDGPVFRTHRHKPWTKHGWRMVLRKYGIPAYALRHTFATRGLAAGVPVAVMSALLGHRDTATTAIYTHIDQMDEVMREAAARAGVTQSSTT